jgi:hypothetical protein
LMMMLISGVDGGGRDKEREGYRRIPSAMDVYQRVMRKKMAKRIQGRRIFVGGRRKREARGRFRGGSVGGGTILGGM